MKTSSPDIHEWPFSSNQTITLSAKLKLRAIGLSGSERKAVADFAHQDIDHGAGAKGHRADILVLFRDNAHSTAITLEDPDGATMVVIVAPKFKQGRGGIEDLREACKIIAKRVHAAAVFLIEGVDPTDNAAFLVQLTSQIQSHPAFFDALVATTKALNAVGYFYYDRALRISPKPRYSSSEPSTKKARSLGPVGHHRNFHVNFRNHTKSIENITRGEGLESRSINRKHPLEEISKNWHGLPSTMPEQPQPDPNAPRYMQASVASQDSPDEAVEYAVAEQDYFVWVGIGAEKEGWAKGTIGFPTQDLFKSPRTKKVQIELVFMAMGQPQPQLDHVTLPVKGDSDLAQFSFQPPKGCKAFTADIFAYHKGKLIQQLLLTVPVVPSAGTHCKAPGVKATIVVATRQNLANIKESKPVSTSLLLQTGPNEKTIVQSFSAQTPEQFNLDEGMQSNLDLIKEALEDSVYEAYPEDLLDAKNVDLLRKLAIYGRMAYDAGLNKLSKFDGPMQIISNRNQFSPIDWAYTLATPADNAPLCSGAIEGLKAGHCQNCSGKPENDENEAKVICPFGFYCLSHVVERHSYQGVTDSGTADYIVTAEPVKGRNVLHILQETLFAASSRVDAVEAGSRAQILQMLEGNSHHATVAKSWDEWTKLIQDKAPDSLILLVHVEKDPVIKIDRIEIETEFLKINQMVPSKVRKSPDAIPPFVIAIGCESTNSRNMGFDLSSKLLQNGAAVVFSSFTKIRGSQMDRIIALMLQFFKAHQGKEIRFGEIVLKLRQYLLSEGIMVGMSLVAHGDADWKIIP